MKLSHAIATRNGLFLANKDRYERVADGIFFGITVRDNYLYCFDSIKPSWTDEESGCIVRFAIEDDGLGPRETMATALHAGCHQIDFVGDHLFVVDTYQQQILEFDSSWRLVNKYWPLPQTRDRNHIDYAHINSIFYRDGCFNIMMHNVGRKQSEILVTDREFVEIERISLPAKSAHDLVPLEDGQFLICNSQKGQLLEQAGQTIQIDALLTRGLSVNATEIVVGSSLFGDRLHRELLPGFVTFLNRDYSRAGRLHIESSPTQIRRLDGDDYSLSNHDMSARSGTH